MLSRKHYQAIAEIIRFRVDCDVDGEMLLYWFVVAEDLASYFKTDNPRFDKDHFLRACGLSERVKT